MKRSDRRKLIQLQARADRHIAKEDQRRQEKLKQRIPMMKVFTDDKLQEMGETLKKWQGQLFDAWFDETGLKPTETGIVIEKGVFGTRIYPDLLPGVSLCERLLAAEDVCEILIEPPPEGLDPDQMAYFEKAKSDRVIAHLEVWKARRQAEYKQGLGRWVEGLLGAFSFKPDDFTVTFWGDRAEFMKQKAALRANEVFTRFLSTILPAAEQEPAEPKS